MQLARPGGHPPPGSFVEGRVGAGRGPRPAISPVGHGARVEIDWVAQQPANAERRDRSKDFVKPPKPLHEFKA